MADLYYRTGTLPAPLPAYIHDEDGNAFSEPFAHTIIEDAGFILAPLKPEDTDEQFAVWTGDSWVMKDRPVVPEPEPAPIESITMRQAKLQLLRAGKLKAANDAIAAMTGQPGEEARVEWEYATTLRRDHPLVAGLGRTLGLDDATIDNLFRAASQIA